MKWLHELERVAALAMLGWLTWRAARSLEAADAGAAEVRANMQRVVDLVLLRAREDEL